MQKEGNSNSDEYLQKSLEPELTVSAEQLDAYSKVLEQYPPGVSEILALPENGELKIGNLSYAFNFQEIDPKEFFLDQDLNLSAMMNSSSDGPTSEQEKILKYHFLFGDYNVNTPDRPRILKDFKITNNALLTDLAISDLIPPSYKIIYKPGDEENFTCDAEGRLVFVEGNLLSLRVILDLLHEIGHAVFLESLTPLEKEQAAENQGRFMDSVIEGGSIGDETLAQNLEGERSAWAFALNKARKILGPSGKAAGNPTILDYAVDYIHKNVLKQNSDRIRKMKDPNHKGVLGEFLDKRMNEIK